MKTQNHKEQQMEGGRRQWDRPCDGKAALEAGHRGHAQKLRSFQRTAPSSRALRSRGYRRTPPTPFPALLTLGQTTVCPSHLQGKIRAPPRLKALQVGLP